MHVTCTDHAENLAHFTAFATPAFVNSIVIAERTTWIRQLSQYFTIKVFQLKSIFKCDDYMHHHSAIESHTFITCMREFYEQLNCGR